MLLYSSRNIQQWNRNMGHGYNECDRTSNDFRTAEDSELFEQKQEEEEEGVAGVGIG